LFGRDPSIPAPVDNPSTPEKVALGKLLYHETSLSKGGDVSCASCHDLSNYGQNGAATGPGGDRNVPTVWNAYRQFALGWDYRGQNVEQFSLMHVLEPQANGVADEAALVKKINGKPDLAAAFAKAFPGGGDAVTAPHFSLALGAFLRTLETKSTFDAFVDGDQRALSNEAKRGLDLFMNKQCITCHTTRLVGGHIPQKTGLRHPYSSSDTGRERLSGNVADKSMFKVPQLLNVEKTAPYFHDGKEKTLEEVVPLMAKLQLDIQLEPEEVDAIIAFLKSLTGPLPPDVAK
jgi:cytochrome c peroxidase